MGSSVCRGPCNTLPLFFFIPYYCNSYGPTLRSAEAFLLVSQCNIWESVARSRLSNTNENDDICKYIFLHFYSGTYLIVLVTVLFTDNTYWNLYFDPYTLLQMFGWVLLWSKARLSTLQRAVDMVSSHFILFTVYEALENCLNCSFTCNLTKYHSCLRQF